MKKEMLKKVVFIILVIFMLLGMVMQTITTVQMLPFVVYLVLAYLDYQKKNINIYMLVLAGLMFLLNIAIFSLLDVITWGIIFGLYI